MTQLLTEADLQASIIAAARDFGWLVYATHNSRRSEPGFPDLTMVRGGRVLFIEVKTATGRLRKGHWNSKGTRWLPGQDEWRLRLLECPGVEYILCRPADLERVYETLC